MVQAYSIGKPGAKWELPERQLWLEKQAVKRPPGCKEISLFLKGFRVLEFRVSGFGFRGLGL